MGIRLSPPSSGRIVEVLDEIEERRQEQLNVSIQDILDPDKTPAEFLPWLAYHYGVDVWSAAWTEAIKRRVIKTAYVNFLKRGTEQGVVEALGALATQVSIREWWEFGSVPGTWEVTVTGDAAATSAEAQGAIDESLTLAGPFTRPYTLIVSAQGAVNMIAGATLRVAKWVPIRATVI